MKAHKIELVVVDFEDYGIDNFLINVKQSSDNYLVKKILAKTVDIGEWDDDHPLNQQDVSKSVVMKYFKGLE
mgnify:CR=1 FL=1